MTTPKLNIPRTCKVEQACGTDPTRSMLLEPYVRDGHLYATDGKIAVRIPASDMTEGPMPGKALCESRKKQRPIVDIGDGWLEIGDIRVRRGQKNSYVPAYTDTVFVIQPSARQITLDGRMLARLLAAMGTPKQVTLHVVDHTLPIVLTAEIKDVPVTGAIMPMRKDRC